MKSFLENISNEIIFKHREILPDICIVFPSRRAGIYFKSILSKKLETPIWSPDVYSIQDFVEELSPYNITDNLQLLFELFSVYSEVIKDEEIKIETENGYANTDDDENFDSFYPWGEMLLKDFDVIDKYLVDTNLLFRRIKDLKEIEESFPLELQDTFKKFWGSLFESNQTGAKQNFLKIWQVLGKVYSEFKNRLAENKICYPGMAYRRMNEDLKSITDNFKWEKIIFAGFNSLNPSEKRLMKTLADKGIAEIYTDADDYYVSDINQEAGNFIRKDLKYFGSKEVKFENNLKNSPKDINIIGVSSKAGMSKVLGSELKTCLSDMEFNIEKTAVVLPDEKMLLPVLYSIPDEIKNINVTMGFPFKDTPLYSLVVLLIELQSNSIFNKGTALFHHSSIDKILLHPYIKFQNTAVTYEIVNLIKEKNLIYFAKNDYAKNIPEIFELIFRKISSVNDAVNYFSKIMDVISDRIENDNGKDIDYKKFHLEYLFNFYTNFNRLNEVIKAPGTEINIETYWKLLKDVLGKISIPFTGEPLKGLQVMGLLETRSLDFENVFILSVNEGVVPEGQSQNSFIPYSLRKALKMPTYEEEDSITAYYFYRLLQRARNIYLIYDTDFGNDAKEKSRFILQVENELIQENKNIKCVNKIVVPEVLNIERKSIETIKDEDVMKKITEMKHFSPSALNKYINCPLQFYLSKIANLEEEITVEETFSAMVLGNVIHKILETLYTPYKEKILSSEILDKIIFEVEENFDIILENAVRDEDSDYVLKEFNGKNYLFSNIVRKLLMRVLENDKKETPFKMINLEEQIEGDFDIDVNGNDIKVKIFGRMDRIDEKENVTRIIDYKTGSFDLEKYDEKNPDYYFENLISNPKYKENFQAFFYGYFYSKMNPEKKINVGIYPVKRIQGGIVELKKGYIEKDEFDLFENMLKKLLVEIHNPEIPFMQTDDEKRCAYCTFSAICYRDLKNTI